MTDREIDALVAEKVMGLIISDIHGEKCEWELWPEMFEYDSEYCYELYGSSGHYIPVKKYSTDIAAAWEVVEKLGSIVGYDFTVEITYDKDTAAFPDKYFCTITNGDSNSLNPKVKLFMGSSEDSAPKAICLAALKVVGVDV